MAAELRQGPAAFTPEQFVELAFRGWGRRIDLAQTAAALAQTTNIGAWVGDRLVGTVRVLSDGYLMSMVPEIMVDPETRRQGVGSQLLQAALDAAPGGRLFLGAQPGNETFFEKAGFRRGPAGFVGRRGGYHAAHDSGIPGV
jgi:GNAT superfamily N-acetyltransferase